MPHETKKPILWHIGGDDVHMRVPLLLELRQRGFDVGVVGSQSHPSFGEHDIPFKHYPLAAQARPFADYRAKIALTRLFRRYRPDVIHAFDTRPAILAPLAAKEAEVPARIRTITGMGRLFSSTSPTLGFLRAAYRTIQRHVGNRCVTVFQNEDDQEYFRSHHLTTDQATALVPGSGIDVEKIQSQAAATRAQGNQQDWQPPVNKIVVTLISRLIWQKGIREFLSAATKLSRSRNDIEFLLVGPLGTEGRHPITLAEIQQHVGVRYLGSRNDVPAILANTDVFVLPTFYREGVPRVLLEAGALGIPLITTDAPGCRDVVRHEREGLIVPARDAEALAHAITRLCDSPELRKSYGTAAQQRVESHFSLARVADAYAEIYHRALRAA